MALAGFADDGNKARLTQELFGKSLAEVAPLLKDLSTQGTLNAKVTKEQADAAEQFTGDRRAGGVEHPSFERRGIGPAARQRPECSIS